MKIYSFAKNKIPVFRNMKNIGVDDIKETMYMYVTMIGSVFVASMMVTCGLCLTRLLFGKFNMWTIFFLPAFVGNVAVFLLPQKCAGYFVNSIVAPIIESQFLRDNKWYWKLIGKSRWVRTAMFMTMSSIIMDTSSRFKCDVFWFLQSMTYRDIKESDHPEPSTWIDKVFPCNRRVCHHTGSCDSHIKSGFKNYLNIGIVLEMVRILFKSFSTIKSDPLNCLNVFASKINLRLIAFLVGYATSYRMLGCTFARLIGKPSEKSNIFAAMLSGCSYLIYPNLTILAHATATAGKMLWMRFVRYANDENQLISSVNALPLAQLVYMTCIAYAFHIRAFYPHSTAGFIHKTTQYTSGMRFDSVSENIGSILMGLNTITK